MSTSFNFWMVCLIGVLIEANKKETVLVFLFFFSLPRHPHPAFGKTKASWSIWLLWEDSKYQQNNLCHVETPALCKELLKSIKESSRDIQQDW